MHLCRKARVGLSEGARDATLLDMQRIQLLLQVKQGVLVLARKLLGFMLQ